MSFVQVLYKSWNSDPSLIDTLGGCNSVKCFTNELIFGEKMAPTLVFHPAKHLRNPKSGEKGMNTQTAKWGWVTIPGLTVLTVEMNLYQARRCLTTPLVVHLDL